MWQRRPRCCSANFLFLSTQIKEKKTKKQNCLSGKLQLCEWVLIKRMWVKMMSTISRHASFPFSMPSISLHFLYNDWVLFFVFWGKIGLVRSYSAITTCQLLNGFMYVIISRKLYFLKFHIVTAFQGCSSIEH